MLVTRREAEPLLGYATGSLKVVMQQQRGRWPDPVACQVRNRALLWDLDQLRAATQTGAEIRSRRPVLDDTAETIECLECRRRFRSLGPHLARGHDTTAAAYREQHQLPASAILMAKPTRAALSEARVEAMANDPELIERMRAGQPSGEELVRRSTEGRAGTDELPAVVAARQRGRDRQRDLSVAARAAAREEAAAAAGYASWDAAIRATMDMPERQAADALGVARTTVRRWRPRTQ